MEQPKITRFRGEYTIYEQAIKSNRARTAAEHFDALPQRTFEQIARECTVHVRAGVPLTPEGAKMMGVPWRGLDSRIR